MKHQPPKWADRFLGWFCNPDLLEDLQGDLYEMYQSNCENGSAFKANLHFIWHVLRSFRYSVIKRNNIHKNAIMPMTTNNIKIAFRVLWNNRFNTLLSLTGLVIGISCFILIGSYVFQELNYDRFHSKKDRIYRVWLKENSDNGQQYFNSTTPPRFEKLFEENFEEVETAVKFDLFQSLVGHGEDRYDEPVALISPEFFTVFDFKIIKGDRTRPLQDKNDVVLSESYAKKYFGNQDPIGKTLSLQVIDELRDYRVTGIMKDIPHNSSISFNIAVSADNEENFYGKSEMEAWFFVRPETYILLAENHSITSVENKMQDVILSYLKEKVKRDEYVPGFQPLPGIHLNPDVPVGLASTGNRNYVYILAAVALLILIVACINYTTFSIGQSLKRSREVGLRKVMGAVKFSLINQYLSESLLLSFIACLVGIGLAYWLLPTFNYFSNANLVLSFEPWHLLIYAGLMIIVGIASGFYPALILSKLKVNLVINGRYRMKGSYSLRQGLVVFQFVITVFLISSTLIMRKQLNYLHNKDLGYSYNATVSMPLYPDPAARKLSDVISTAMDKGKLLQQRLSQYPEIEDMAIGSHVFGSPNWTQVGFKDDKDDYKEFRLLVTDPHYLPTFNIKLKQGRNFDPGSEFDQRDAIIINQAAADYFGWDNALDKQLPGNKFGHHHIIGVTENFNFHSLRSSVEPLVITQEPRLIFDGISDLSIEDSPTPKLIFRYTGSRLSEVKEILDKTWNDVFAIEDLEFTFLEENIRRQYQSEDKMNQLVTLCTIISIIIASIGLLGLTILVVSNKVKEVGIRKVNGATTLNIFSLLVKSFSLPLLTGIALSVPVTYLLMSRWLSDFAYHINLDAGVFILSALISLFTALLVISYHTIRAARANPVRSLRME